MTRIPTMIISYGFFFPVFFILNASYYTMHATTIIKFNLHGVPNTDPNNIFLSNMNSVTSTGLVDTGKLEVEMGC